MKLSLRDFIYLDTDRLKSIIAQFEGGIATSATEGKITTKQLEAEIKGNLIAVVNAKGGASYLWQNENKETKSLHDYIYNKVEEILVSNELLTKIPEDITSEDVSSGLAKDMISPTSFILIKGKVNINDYKKMKNIIEKFNELGKFIGRCSIMGKDMSDFTKKQQQDALVEAQNSMKIDDWLLKGIDLFIETFYKDRLVIKLAPFDDSLQFHFAGDLNKAYLREEIDSIIYKYGTAPQEEWTIFAQVASIPKENNEGRVNIVGGSELEIGMSDIFNSLREVEYMAQQILFPEIAITPIAVYRE